MRNSEGMARRIYPIDGVMEISLRLACITKEQMMDPNRDPSWAYMSRSAVSGVIYELCETSEPELSQMFGVKRTTIHAQIKRFREGWPVAIRRMWIEAVLCGLCLKYDPEPVVIKNPQSPMATGG